ncbi:hypothetical protein P3T76_002837 [Phytophthora citrophthora]|uniref:tRNA-splicing endonuclease subunit Sen54 N-terminal domain-containing protein n=1 Tax=Phytophthora citrophthora TaxID=4793 RepID=A0AAD9LT67_9STRA|nr:hypothetical protein P3T76_002837 [Phytophthora citrophthora]
MARLGKDVSVGEYDPETGLTHITCQRGRLLFNMGASVKKQQRREPPSKAPPVTTKTTPPPTSTGAYTGLSLYPEEANYLVQRGALTVYLMGHKATGLSVAAFTSMLFKDARVSLACMEVYTFLKDQKLHPRRCLEPVMAIAGNDDGRSVPRCSKESEHCDVAFDVWKTTTVNVDPSPADTPAALSKSKKAKQRKKLVLMFRVAVFRYEDAAPNPQSLRQVIEGSKSRGDGTGCSSLVTCSQIPVKVAVVHHDQSVLLFEISGNPAVPKQLQPDQRLQQGQAIKDGVESH